MSEPTGCVPIYGHKGGAGYEVAVRGEAAHSSRPELGRSAIVAAARAVLALQDEHDRLQTEEPLTEVGVGSINVGLISGGTAGNIVPDLCTFTVGRRVCPGEDAEAVAAALQELIEGAVAPCTATFTPIGTGVPSAGFYQPPDTPVVRTLAEATGSAPAVAPYGTNALRYVGFGEQLVVFGPGSIDDAHKATGSAWRSASSSAAPRPSKPGCARAETPPSLKNVQMTGSVGSRPIATRPTCG